MEHLETENFSEGFEVDVEVAAGGVFFTGGNNASLTGLSCSHFPPFPGEAVLFGYVSLEGDHAPVP